MVAREESPMSYAEAWRENRRRWKWFLLLWIGGPIVLGVLSFLVSGVGSLFLSPRLLKEMMNLVSLLGGLIWVFGTLTMGFKLFFSFHCPRCEKLFYLKGLGGNAFARHCQHCRLRKGELEPPDEHQPR
jgi:hypothetical protein